MKHLILSFAIVLFASPSWAQGVDITPRVTEAFKAGDAGLLGAMMTSPVEIELSGQDGSYTPSEAKALLSRFFAQNIVKDFAIKHQGTSKLDDQYRIGDLVTSTATYRVTFFMKKTPGGMFIKQLTIESPDGF